MTPIISPELPAHRPELMQRITAAYLRDESEHVEELLKTAPLPESAGRTAQAEAIGLVERTRLRASDPAMVEAFMREYDLSSEEGVLLMCVAEALLRIPDQDTADKLIRDKLGDADWDSHVGQSTSLLVNASTWGLMLTGRLVNLADETQRDVRRRVQAPDRPHGRAGDPPGGAPGHAHHGPPVRDGPHHRRGAGTLAQGRQRQLPLFASTCSAKAR